MKNKILFPLPCRHPAHQRGLCDQCALRPVRRQRKRRQPRPDQHPDCMQAADKMTGEPFASGALDKVSIRPPCSPSAASSTTPASRLTPTCSSKNPRRPAQQRQGRDHHDRRLWAASAEGIRWPKQIPAAGSATRTSLCPARSSSSPCAPATPASPLTVSNCR